MNQVQGTTTRSLHSYAHKTHQYNKQWTTSTSISGPYSAPYVSATSSFLHCSTYLCTRTHTRDTHRTEHQLRTTTRTAHASTHAAWTPREDNIQSHILQWHQRSTNESNPLMAITPWTLHTTTPTRPHRLPSQILSTTGLCVFYMPPMCFLCVFMFMFFIYIVYIYSICNTVQA
jgi:hypothetical protein